MATSTDPRSRPVGAALIKLRLVRSLDVAAGLASAARSRVVRGRPSKARPGRIRRLGPVLVADVRSWLAGRHRAAVLGVLLVAAVLVSVDLVRGDTEGGRRPGETTPAGAADPPTAESLVTVPVTFPVTGAGGFAYAAGTGPVLGRAGRLLRFRVAVEEGAGQDVAGFAATVERILGDGRGWTASERLRLQRVSRTTAARFTVFLATPGTSERMCARAGLVTQRFTGCQFSGKVVINLARWSRGVPGYGAPLAAYRVYEVNHEVGRELGYRAQRCPGPGQLAPVLQRQVLGLQGCRANGWPYVDGSRYSGPPAR